MESKEFLKKYVISEDGTVANKKTGEVIEPKKGSVKLKTPKGKKKFKVSELLSTYFPKERNMDDNGDVEEPKDTETIKEVEKTVSNPQKVRDYYIANPEEFNVTVCALELQLSEAYVKRTVDAYLRKITVKLGTNIIVSLQYEGVHKWEGCPFEEVAFLRDAHRHIFYIVAKKEVSHDDRDIEIIMLKRSIEEFLKKEFNGDFENRSCEMIAKIILKEFDLDYCSVLEDNENGAEVIKR